MRITHLKIKIKTLAAEAAIIRHEERAALLRGQEHAKLSHGENDEYHELYGHRKEIVRPVARHNLLAYGFLRGVPYARMEAANTRVDPDWSRVKKLVWRFDDPQKGLTAPGWEKWKAAAEEHLASCNEDSVALREVA